MRNFFVALFVLCVGCQSQARDGLTPLRVGTTPVPHAEMLEPLKKRLEQQGVRLEVVVFNDYVQPNLRTLDGDLDANFFQTAPLFEAFNRDHDGKLAAVVGVHVEPFGVYSHTIKDLETLPQGATVLVPSEVSNDFRALRLLHAAGYLKLGHPDAVYGGASDIIDNPRGLRIKTIEAAMLPRVWEESDLAGINTNFALAAGLRPDRDALLVEDAQSPYVNILVTRRERLNDAAVQALRAALVSEESRQFMLETYKGAVVPTF